MSRVRSDPRDGFGHGYFLKGETPGLDFRGVAEGVVEIGLRAADRIIQGDTVESLF